MPMNDSLLAFLQKNEYLVTCTILSDYHCLLSVPKHFDRPPQQVEFIYNEREHTLGITVNDVTAKHYLDEYVIRPMILSYILNECRRINYAAENVLYMDSNCRRLLNLAALADPKGDTRKKEFRLSKLMTMAMDEKYDKKYDDMAKAEGLYIPYAIIKGVCGEKLA